MLASFLEAPILAWTDRAKAKRHLVFFGGLAGMAASVALVSFIDGIYGLALTMLLYGPAAGLALGTAESMLVDGVDETLAARRLARWEIFGALGDVLAPAVVAASRWAHVGWRASFRVAALAIFAVAMLSLVVRPPPAGVEADEPEEPILASLREALANRRLAAWLFGAALCTLLDEMLAVLVSLWVAERFSPELAAPALIAFSSGCVLGGIALDRGLLHVSKRTAVVVSSIGCVIAIAGWLTASSWPAVLAWGSVVGLCAGPLHPLAKAEAFAVMPTRPGLVNGAAQAFVVIDILAPVVLAAIAERWGARFAIGTLVLQPLGLLVIALGARRRDER